MNRLVLVIAVLCIIPFIGACKKDSEEIIPKVRFTGQLDLINQNPLYLQNQSFIVERDTYGRRLGLHGVVIFKLHSEEFYAFDIMCPHEKHVNSLVEIDGDNMGYCICPTCKSEFSVNTEYGGVIEGPSKWPLQGYNTEVRNGNLYIWY
ncbi:Rieske 2Fe-2S domain-containing protein [Labilibacter sediminis]|nr:Rieske 2Fe-2S domain-containing protein [Labilibacter sediminis]